ncbi:MAG: Wzz/FepE/Etk N-terminal domain-containing protein, partial [Candidatus Cloacimonadaceae bacterium]|nr:Wzz/FepE/Etk N-terminal domain-containing protein [Candidatus Cloacimonadaceae bacterium]
VFDVFELLRVILKNRLAIGILVLVVGITAVIYSLLTPQIWMSKSSFYVVGSKTMNLGLGISGLGGLAGDLMEAQRDSDSYKAMAVMQSSSFTEDVIRKFDLIRFFELTDKDTLMNMDTALLKMQKIVSYDYGAKSSLITVSVETKSKALSMNMAKYYVQRLDTYNRELKVTKGKRDRIFLENRVGQLRGEIDSLMAANREFQEKYKAVNLKDQSESLIKTYSSLISDKMKLDVQIELARTNYDAASPLVTNLETQRDALMEQIRGLESSGSALKPEYLINLSSIPSIGEKAAQLKLSLSIAQQLYETLYPQYEEARLEELRDIPSLELLDIPREAGLRVRPRRAMICMVSVLVAFFLGTVLAIIKETILNSKERIAILRNILHDKQDPEA